MSDVTVLLLRGVNVGGHGRLPMADLRAILADLGARDVATYIQSGNAVFRGALKAPAITAAISARAGFAPQALALPLADYAARLDANPFPETAAAALDDTKILHVYFLGARPDPLPAKVLNLAAKGERLQIAEGAAYLHAPDGIGRSKLAAALDKALGVPATARNWKTATKLRAMAEALA